MTPAAPPPARGTSKLWRDTQKWTRWLHTYASMLALLVVLFFGFTGVTLNHPDWTFGFGPTEETVSGTLPADWQTADGSVEFLTVSEFLRSEHAIRGEVTDFGQTSADGFISYRGPGYSADAFFDLGTESYEITVEQQGWVGILNDLHKGRDTVSSWNWLIDVSGIFLVAIAITGLALQLLLRKRRRSALTVAGIGTLITVLLTVIAVT